MKNIINLFKHDLSNIRKSVIGLIVMVGLVIVPVLYAWFNIAGSWDPYGNTGNLKVAVANSDEGYTSDLIPIKINMGVTSALRANDALDWVFVDEDAAIEGVKSGEYYAAVVIPQEFSADMMTLFSTEVKHSEIIYYENQKANAIAPRVTDKGASTVRQQIDETFTQTIGDIGLATSSSLLEFMDSDEVKNYVSNLSSTLDGGISSLRDAASTAGSFGGLMGSTSSLVSSAGDLLGTSGETSDRSQELLTDAKAGLASVQGALGDSADSINDALASVSGSFDDVSSAVDDVFDAAGTQSQDTQDQMNALADKVGAQASKIEAITAEISALLEGDDTYRCLLTVPGIGPKTASELAISIDIEDFPSHDRLASYCGLAPRNRQSGTSISSVTASRQGNKRLKSLLIFSCNCLTRTEGRWGDYYTRCRERGMSHGKALKALARKRLKVIYAVMRDRVPYAA